MLTHDVCVCVCACVCVCVCARSTFGISNSTVRSGLGNTTQTSQQVSTDPAKQQVCP